MPISLIVCSKLYIADFYIVAPRGMSADHINVKIRLISWSHFLKVDIAKDFAEDVCVFLTMNVSF